MSSLEAIEINCLQFWFDNLGSKSIFSGLPNSRYAVRTNKPGGFILPILCLKQQNTK